MLQKNKICFVTTIPDFARSFLIRYLRELSKENEVFLISNFQDIENDREFFKGVTLVHVPIVRKISLFADVIALAKIFMFFRREKFTIVHSGTPKAGLLAMVAARSAGVPLRFHTFTGQVWATKTGVLRWLLKTIDRVIYRCASDVLVDSHSQRDFLINEGIIDEERSYVLGKGSICGVDADRFRPDFEQRTAMRNLLHIPMDAFVFFFLGRMTKEKGIEELLEAFARIANDHSDAYLVLVGDEDELNLKAERPLLFKTGRVMYEGPTSTPEAYLSAVDVLCLPSHREGFGMVVIEAAAAGIPSIGSRINGIIDAIQDGVTGLLHPKKDVTALYECMRNCIDDRNKTRQLGLQARERAVRDFSSQHMTEEFLRYYNLKLHQADIPAVKVPPEAAGANPMKVLFLTRVPMTAMRFIFPLAKKMREQGSIVEFASGPGESMEEMRASGFPFTLLSMNTNSNSIKNIRVFNQLKDIIVNGKFDVVHTYTPVMGLYGRLAAFKAKTPIVIHSVTGSLLGSGVPLLHRLFYFLSELTTYRMVDLFITLNEEDRQTLLKYRFASKADVVLLKHEYGVDLQRFNPDNIDKTRLEKMRKEYRLDENIPVIGFVGRMIGAKGILDLFEAYKQIRAQGIRAKLIFLGDVLPSVKDRRSYTLLKSRVRESGYEDDVIFWGWQEEVPFYLSMMDVVVLPSHYEGFPRIPVEAGAMCKPSVSTATSGSEIAIEEGVTGFVVPIKDPQRLAEAIQKIIADPDLAREMGKAARRRVVDFFDQNKIVDQQLGIYSDLLKKSQFDGDQLSIHAGSLLNDNELSESAGAWSEIPQSDLEDVNRRLQLISPQLYQYPFWNEPFRRLHFKPRYLCYKVGDREVACVCILSLDLPFLRLGMVRYGPISLTEGSIPSQACLQSLEEWARQKGYMFLRFSHSDERILAVIKSLRGCKEMDAFPLYPEEPEALIIRWQGDEKKTLASFSKTARFKINQGTKVGYEIRQSDDPKTFDQVWFLNELMVSRKQINTRPLAYYQDLVTFAARTGAMRLYTASLEGKVVQSILIIFAGKTAYYIWGALDTRDVGNHSPSSMLHWHAMRDCFNLGMDSYHLGHRSGSVYQFKRQFHPEEITTPPSVTLVINKFTFFLWSATVTKLSTQILVWLRRMWQSL